MVVRVRQEQYIQHTTVEKQQQPAVITKRKSKITAKEKFLYLAFIVTVAVFAVIILNKQSAIHKTNMEIQNIEKEITTVNEKNGELKVQVDELSTYERIIEKAKALGLTLNEKNVKVVPGE